MNEREGDYIHVLTRVRSHLPLEGGYWNHGSDKSLPVVRYTNCWPKSRVSVAASIVSKCMLSNSVILLRHHISACTSVHVWRYQVILFSLCINSSVIALRYQSSRFLCIFYSH